MNEHLLFIRQLGQFDLTLAKPYESKAFPETGWMASLPNRGTTDAWTDAVTGFQSSAVRECQQACRADHLREFTWYPEFSGQNWTLLLMPAYSTFYMDDEGKPRPVLVNGQSGKFYGSRRASLRRAQKTSLILVGLAVLVFLLSLITSFAAAVFPLLLTLGGIGIVLALLIGLAALAPLVIAWRTNRHSQAVN